jgi:hypothetical protein
MKTKSVKLYNEAKCMQCLYAHDSKRRYKFREDLLCSHVTPRALARTLPSSSGGAVPCPCEGQFLHNGKEMTAAVNIVRRIQQTEKHSS